MHRIDTANARPNVNGTGKTGFHDNTDLAGQDATYLDPDWCNALQEEVATVIEAHEPLDKAKHGQLKASLLAIFATNTALDEVDHRLSAAMTALASAMQQAIIDERNAERNRVWPVGTGRYTTYDGLNPAHASHLGWGTWVADTLSAGRVLVGAGEATDVNGEVVIFANAAQGGEFKHLQASDEMFKHTHRLPHTNFTTANIDDEIDLSSKVMNANLNRVIPSDTGPGDNGYAKQIDDVCFEGGHTAMNVMQPYLVVSVWRRTG